MDDKEDKKISTMLKEAGAPNFYPTGPRYLIEVMEVEEVTKGGIVITAKQKQNEEFAAREARILRWGSDRCNYHFYKSPNWATLGDKILISVSAGEKLYTKELKPTRFRVIDGDAILGRIEE